MSSNKVALITAGGSGMGAALNSAGHGPRGPVLELSDEDWHLGLDVYFLSAVRPTWLVAPIMRAQKSGSIINISTFAAFEPDPVLASEGGGYITGQNLRVDGGITRAV